MNQPTDLPVLPEDPNTPAPGQVTVVDLTEPKRPAPVAAAVTQAVPVTQETLVVTPQNTLPPLEEAPEPQVRRQFPLSEMGAIQAPLAEVARTHIPPVSPEVEEIIIPKQKKADFSKISQPHNGSARIGLVSVIIILTVIAGFLAVNILNTPAGPTNFALEEQKNNQQANQDNEEQPDTQVSNELQQPEELDNRITLPETPISSGENTPPNVNIVTPEPNSELFAGAFDADGNAFMPIEFNGNATDEQDGGLTGNSLVWSIKQSGGSLEQIGTGINISYPLYASECSNSFEVQLEATDSQGAKSSSMLNFTLNKECSAE